MDPGAAAAQVYNMQNKNNLFMTRNEKIIGDKADSAMYKASEAEYMADDLSSKLSSLVRSEAFIYGTISVVLIALILVYRSVM